MTAVGRARLSLLLVVTLTLQLTLLGGIRIAGVHPDAMVLVAVAAGLVGGTDRGATMGFATGLVTDLFLQTPFGLSDLTFCIVGYLVGMFQGGLIRSAWWIPVLTAVVASAGGETLYAMIGGIVGQGHMINVRLGLVAGVVGAVNGLLALVVVPAMRWAMEAGPTPRPAAVGRW